MNETIQRIDHDSEKALESLVGCEVQELLSKSANIEVGQSVLQVVSVSIQLSKKRFLVIESDWEDTAQEYLDYHCLSVRTAGSPKDIKYNPKPQKGGANYQFDHVHLALGASAPVAKIELLESREVGVAESVTYDAGLVITRSDGLRFAIVREESILGALHIAHVPQDIERLVHGLHVRLRYGA